MSNTETTARDAVAQARRNYLATAVGPEPGSNVDPIGSAARSPARWLERFRGRRAAAAAGPGPARGTAISIAIVAALLLATSPAVADQATRPGFAELCVAVHGVGYCRTLARAILACRSADFLWACVGRQSYHEQITDSGVTIFRGGQ